MAKYVVNMPRTQILLKVHSAFSLVFVAFFFFYWFEGTSELNLGVSMVEEARVRISKFKELYHENL